jgi:hypothetical protein
LLPTKPVAAFWTLSVLIANSLTPALAFPEEPVLEAELEEPVEEFELFPVSEDKALDEAGSGWALAVADVRIARIRIDQMLIAGRSIEESSGRAFPTNVASSVKTADPM